MLRVSNTPFTGRKAACASGKAVAPANSRRNTVKCTAALDGSRIASTVGSAALAVALGCSNAVAADLSSAFPTTVATPVEQVALNLPKFDPKEAAENLQERSDQTFRDIQNSAAKTGSDVNQQRPDLQNNSLVKPLEKAADAVKNVSSDNPLEKAASNVDRAVNRITPDLSVNSVNNFREEQAERADAVGKEAREKSKEVLSSIGVPIKNTSASYYNPADLQKNVVFGQSSELNAAALGRLSGKTGQSAGDSDIARSQKDKLEKYAPFDLTGDAADAAKSVSRKAGNVVDDLTSKANSLGKDAKNKASSATSGLNVNKRNISNTVFDPASLQKNVVFGQSQGLNSAALGRLSGKTGQSAGDTDVAQSQRAKGDKYNPLNLAGDAGDAVKSVTNAVGDAKSLSRKAGNAVDDLTSKANSLGKDAKSKASSATSGLNINKRNISNTVFDPASLQKNVVFGQSQGLNSAALGRLSGKTGQSAGDTDVAQSQRAKGDKYNPLNLAGDAGDAVKSVTNAVGDAGNVGDNLLQGVKDLGRKVGSLGDDVADNTKDLNRAGDDLQRNAKNVLKKGNNFGNDLNKNVKDVSRKGSSIGDDVQKNANDLSRKAGGLGDAGKDVSRKVGSIGEDIKDRVSNIGDDIKNATKDIDTKNI
eukprot:jgi/Chrzof1/3977/Cz13g15210.t1